MTTARVRLSAGYPKHHSPAVPSATANEPLSCAPLRWRGVAARLIRGSGIEAVLTITGGHLACLRRIGETLNPLWQPHWPATHPSLVPHEGSWGSWPASTTNATIVGSNLCLDRFGCPPGDDGRPQHGEAGVVDWTCRQPASDLVTFSTRLPLAGLDAERMVSIGGGWLRLTTRVRTCDGRARTVACCEHTSLGGAFLHGAVCSAGVDRIWAGPSPDRPGRTVAQALALPRDGDAPRGDVFSCRVAEGWWRVDHAGLNRRLEACWDPRDYPWLCVWTEDRHVVRHPWDSRGRARGLELSATPYPDGLPPAQRRRRWQGRPVGLMLPAATWRVMTVCFRWGPIRGSSTDASKPVPSYMTQRPR